MKLLYFAHPILSYNTEIEQQCINIINKQIQNIIILNPSLFKDDLSKIKTEKERMEYCYNKIDNSDIFVYLFQEKVKDGVRKELNYALYKNKQIYKIKYINNNLILTEMSDTNIQTFIKNINKTANRSKWVLKTKDDYITWFKNNPEAIKLIKDQFDDENSFYVPHYNTVYLTDNFTTTTMKYCKQHNINKIINHGFLDTRYQEAKITCPFFEESSLIIGYDTYNLPRIKNLTFSKLLECRTIHRNMRICKDHNTILGTYPTFDLDIKKETKQEGKNFFTPEVFNEYTKVINLIHKYMDEKWNGISYKTAFSGNGIYFIMEKLIYKDNNINEEMFYHSWRETTIKQLISLLNKNGIKNIIPEKKYGWQRYFKAIGTFHLSHERVSIPLNKDEPLDYKWINEITKIENGLSQNIFSEIINRAGNTWR